ncbi:MAG: hypothetical protein AB7Y74_07195 [Syntrophorhabdus sp.]
MDGRAATRPNGPPFDDDEGFPWYLFQIIFYGLLDRLLGLSTACIELLAKIAFSVKQRDCDHWHLEIGWGRGSTLSWAI